jgi:hypothetical protein
MTHARDKTTKRLQDGTLPLPRRFGLLVLALAGLAALGVLAAGCGAGGSPAVANLASTTRSVASVASTTTTTTTTATTAKTTPSGSSGGASGVGGSPAGPGGGGNHTVINIGNPAEGTRFAACVRKHGLPSFPDPNSQGVITFGSSIDPRSPIFRSAKNSCQNLLPAGFGQPPTQAQLDQVQQQLLAFSSCMRTHTIKDFPDPSGGGLPQIQPVGDLDPNNPRFLSAYNACKAHLPAGLPSKALGGLAPPVTGGG